MCLIRHHVVMLTFSRNSLSLLSPTNHTAAFLQTSVVKALIKRPHFTIQIRQNGKHEFSLHASTERQILRKTFCIANVHIKNTAFGTLCTMFVLQQYSRTKSFCRQIRVPTLSQPNIRPNRCSPNHVTNFIALIII
jgi:hypothetical protein